MLRDHEVGYISKATSPAAKASPADQYISGKLTKDLSHLSVQFTRAKNDTIDIELHHGARKSVATLRTVKTIINNLIIGVTKGFKYKMRYVYAHFPINVNIEKNNDTGLFEVEIR